MSEELSGKTIVIFIACGILTLFVLFIFAKRQIARFTLKSHRGPHIAIGHDAPKSLQRETDRRINRVTEIRYEPKVLTRAEEAKYSDPQTVCQLPAHYYRMKATDGLIVLETEIKERQPTLKRGPGENLRKFLLGLLGGPLQGANSRIVHQFCDAYDHARYDPRDFGPDEYGAYMDLLTQLLQCVNTASSSKSSSARSSPKVTSFKVKHSGGSVSLKGKQVTFIQRPSSLDIEDPSSSETKV